MNSDRTRGGTDETSRDSLPGRDQLGQLRPLGLWQRVCGWSVDGSLRPKNELEGTLGKGTESLLLGDGDAPLRFSSIARQAGTVHTTS